MLNRVINVNINFDKVMFIQVMNPLKNNYTPILSLICGYFFLWLIKKSTKFILCTHLLLLIFVTLDTIVGEQNNRWVCIIVAIMGTVSHNIYHIVFHQQPSYPILSRWSNNKVPNFQKYLSQWPFRV